jgi:addiction module HigA family antidote
MAETAAILVWTLVAECPIPPDINDVLVSGEVAIAAYRTFRDSAIFTNKRLIVRDAQGQYRVCFRWTAGGAEDVEIVDYHQGAPSMDEKLKPVTPGELLFEEFLLPMGITRYRLAKEIGVPAQRIGEIVAGRRAVTADTDLRLCRFFGLSNGYWLRAQAAYDTEVAEEALAEQLARIRPWGEPAA